MLEVVVEGLRVNGVKVEGLPVEDEVLVFLVEFMDMLDGVSDVALANGSP